MNEHQILSRDLLILEEMIKEIAAYLMSESMRWTMAHGDMPKLTIGGCLMRQHRLHVLQSQLDTEEQTRLQEAIRQFEQVLDEKVVCFEHRTHQELHVRLREWAGHLRGLRSNILAEIEHYANVVDTRVVITAMIYKLQQPPYRLDVRITEELAMLDQNLRNRWQAGKFVWPPIWKPAYTEEEYWYLYGRRKQPSER